jgi:hypothetical protein
MTVGIGANLDRPEVPAQREPFGTNFLGGGAVQVAACTSASASFGEVGNRPQNHFDDPVRDHAHFPDHRATGDRSRHHVGGLGHYWRAKRASCPMRPIAVTADVAGKRRG